jgi:hypothetical protein
MRSTEPIEVPPYLCTMSAIVVLNWKCYRAGALGTAARRKSRDASLQRVQHTRICPGAAIAFRLRTPATAPYRGIRGVSIAPFGSLIAP